MNGKAKSGYQTVINGKVFPIEDLTREELIAELISCIDLIEDLDDTQDHIRFKISMWRTGNHDVQER